MYNILVVDDEDIERRGLKSLIKKYEFELVVKEACNGEEALEIIKKSPIDILLTDIKMPFMNGIDLAQESLKIIPNLKIIFYSAYSEFEYAKKAIDLDVKKYILKPIDIPQFKEAIHKVIKLCQEEAKEKIRNTKITKIQQKNNQYKIATLFCNLIYKKMKTEDIIEQLDSIGIEVKNHYIRIILFDYNYNFFEEHISNFNQAMDQLLPNKHYIINLNGYQSVIIMIDSAEKLAYKNVATTFSKVKKWMTEHYDNNDFFIVISECIDDLDKVSDSYKHMDVHLDNKFILKSDIVFIDNNQVNMQDIHNYIQENIQKLIASIGEIDLSKLRNDLEFFFYNLKLHKKRVSSIFLKYQCIEVIKAILKYYNNPHLNQLDSIIEDILKTQSINQLQELMKNYINDHIPVDHSTDQFIISKTIQMIETNYMEDIGLKQIADKLYLSPSYLSHYFKKEVGVSLVQYITNYRLEKAIDLLCTSNMKIIDIAKRVGYTDVSYFGKVFKTTYEMTPMQYRKKREY